MRPANFLNFIVMKKILQYLFLFILIGFSTYFIYQNSRSPCERVIEYSIGRFDTQFGVSENEFKLSIAESEKVWEKALNRNVFVYKSGADFKINLIYDERQLATNQKQKTEFGLLAAEEAFRNLDSKFNIFKNEYENKVAVHEQRLSIFNERKSDYDKEVALWNKKGGAPENVFRDLETERNYLNAEAQRLNNETNVINDIAKELNTLLEDRNLKAVEYNKTAKNYNKKYGEGLEFNQAEYKSDSSITKKEEINVYQFSNKKDLILALSHEFGHALGMGHNENPKSIMYYLTGINAESTPVLSAEDLIELNRVCK